MSLYIALAVLVVIILIAVPKKRSDTKAAEAYIRNNTALYRHYNIRGVQDILKGNIGSQGFIADLDDKEVSEIVKKIRDEQGLGPN